MAVKQKNVGSVAGVTTSAEMRLQVILRALQDWQTREASTEMYAKVVCASVCALGRITVPSDPATYMKFIEDINTVQDILIKKCANKQNVIFVTLKAMYDEISNPAKNPSPVMSIVLQLITERKAAVKFILNSGYPEENLKKALFTLCMWLTKWTYSDNLGPLVLTFMEGLASEHHYEILMEVTLVTIEPLFKLLILRSSRGSVWPVVEYMLKRVQHEPEVFHKVIPHIPKLVQILCKDEENRHFLEYLVHLCAELMEHFPGHNELYEPLKNVLAPHLGSSFKKGLNCEPWVSVVPCGTPLRSVAGKVGLYNLGNTCYMNSVLQALFMTKTFRNEILLHNNDDTMMPVLFAKLRILFALLQHSKKVNLSPKEILKLLRPPGFMIGSQHDSSEFLGFLLDTLHEQEKGSGGGTAMSMEPSIELNLTIVQQSFGGKTVTVSHCNECGTKSEKIDNFRELSLSFPSNSDNLAVQDLLDYYMQPEQLCGDNQYRCDVCDGLTDGERITKVVEAPARLILTLKHFGYDPMSKTRTKLLQRVKLDNQITLEGAQFDLYAAVVHCGTSVDSGHYYTFARDGTDWYKFNDVCVSKTSEDELHCLKPPETPYILFYSREDLGEPENLSCAELSSDLQLLLAKDASEADLEMKQRVNLYQSMIKRPPHRNNDDPPPPGCGGGGFSATSGNMFVC